MKNGRMLVASLALVAIGVAGVVAQHRGGEYSPQNTGNVMQSEALPLTGDAKYEVASYPVFDAGLADGAGRAQVQVYCSSCHTPRYITMQPPLPAATWEAEVQKMIKTYGATVPNEDARKITAYLKEHYTPETRN